MKLILTKAECKQNTGTRIKSQKELKTEAQEPIFPIMQKTYSSHENMVDDLLFSRVSFTKKLKLTTRKDSKIFILENCSLYKTYTKAQLAH